MRRGSVGGRSSANSRLSRYEYADSGHTMKSAPARCRSEERRVGKECRYWCDWSSDVCSSDLDATGIGGREILGELTAQQVRVRRLGPHDEVRAGALQVGRASCRERV